MTNTFYKIRHKSTGLFYKPCSNTKGINLSIKGKTYQTKPPLKTYCIQSLRLGFNKIGHKYGISGSRMYDKPIYASFDKDEWEIVEYQASMRIVEW